MDGGPNPDATFHSAKGEEDVETTDQISKTLLEMIESRKAKVCVVGLGYVGIPLSVASAEAGFTVTGVDVDKGKVAQTNSGKCYVEDMYSEELLPQLVRDGHIRASTSLAEEATDANVIIICVPTPLDARGRPDLSYVRSVGTNLSKYLRKFKLVILESTSFPGTTEGILRPLLEKSGKKAGSDFALVYSPERIDYGNPKFSVKDIAKVVGGINGISTKLGVAFYKSILKAPVIEVSSPSVAEASKMLENVFRYVNIALVNELSVLHEKLGVDFIEAVEAAATKPFGFMPHYPGPGIGGHCIPKDPFYLTYRARQVGLPLKLVSAASTVNEMMPKHVVFRMLKALKSARITPTRSVVAVWGLAYKGGVKDTRRSPALEIIRLLHKSGISVRVYDPFVPQVSVNGRVHQSASSLEESVSQANAILIVTNHEQFKHPPLDRLKKSMMPHPILYDTKNLVSREECEKAGFTYMAVGRP